MGTCRMRALLLLLAVTAAIAANAADSLPAWTRPRSAARRGKQVRTANVPDSAARARRQLLQAGTLPGLQVQVYNSYGSPYTLPIPTTLKPSAVKTALNISYPDASTGTGLMALANASTNFGLRFSGFLRINGTGTATVNYTFLLESDDGSQLYIDSKLVDSAPGEHGFNANHSTSVLLAPGMHAFEIDYSQQTGLAGIVLYYATGKSPAAVVPSSWFSHAPAPAPPPPYKPPPPSPKPKSPPPARPPPPHHPPPPAVKPKPPPKKPPPPPHKPPPPPPKSPPPPPPLQCREERGGSVCGSVCCYGDCYDDGSGPSCETVCQGCGYGSQTCLDDLNYYGRGSCCENPTDPNTGEPGTGSYEYCYSADGYCCSNCQENKAGKYVCCAAGTLPCNQGRNSGDYGFAYACCPPHYSCDYYLFEHGGPPNAICCPPGTTGCAGGMKGTGHCCTPPQTCKTVANKDPYCA